MKYKVTLPLTKPATKELEAQVAGTKVSLSLGVASVVLDGLEASSGAAAEQQARHVAARFLDYVSYEFGFTADTEPNSAALEWVDPESGRVVKGSQVHVAAGVSVTASLKLTDKDGNILYDSDRPGNVQFRRLDAFAYYRRAELSSDVFDRFRNYYLAAENAASHMNAHLRWGETQDKKAFLHGLGEAYGADPGKLLDATAKLTGTAYGSVEKAGEVLYERFRCALNHSKEGAGRMVPYDVDDERRVGVALPLMKDVALSMTQRALALGAAQ